MFCFDGRKFRVNAEFRSYEDEDTLTELIKQALSEHAGLVEVVVFEVGA